MNYYERHLGDYARDTGHLSIIEHGVYTILLDRYYVTERGIPDSQKYRLSRARTEEEVRAVDVVLDEFFTISEGVWVNQRAEEEIARMKSKIIAAQENGKKGGRPPRGNNPTHNPDETQEKPSNNPTHNPDESSPVTSNQTPVLKPVVKTALGGNSPACERAQGTAAGEICSRLKSEVGLTGVNPSHPELLASLESGITADEIIDAGHDAKARGKGFAYAIATAKGRRMDAASNSAMLPNARASPAGRSGKQAIRDSYAAQAAAARGENHGTQHERDISGESVRIA